MLWPIQAELTGISLLQDVLGVIGSMRPLVVCPENFSAHWVEPGQPLVDDKLQRELGMSTGTRIRALLSTPVFVFAVKTFAPGRQWSNRTH
jgi:hypothetical protein